MTQYLVLPVDAYGSWLESCDDAAAMARDNAAKYETDFVVVEVKFVTGFERVSPIRMDRDPHPQLQHAQPPVHPAFENPDLVK